ncbi:MAG: hypothetical protein VZQ47_05525 [Treponema sp.]|nr:hypothetical protein [Treponema sp.]MEE3434994.1 hypothetical protein [Treponema sp.]
MDYDMSKYGSNITSGGDTESIAKEILDLLSKNEGINLDFTCIDLMTTTAAKEILKPLAVKFGIDNIFKKVHFCNVSEDLKVVISTAIEGLNL